MNKILLLLLLVIIGAMAILGLKIRSASVLGTNTSNGSISLSTNPNPLRPGPATFLIDIKDKSGKPVDNAVVTYDINMTTMNMGTQKGNATSLGNGRYSANGNMSMLGPWRIRTTIKMPDDSVENKDFTVNVQGK